MSIPYDLYREYDRAMKKQGGAKFYYKHKPTIVGMPLDDVARVYRYGIDNGIFYNAHVCCGDLSNDKVPLTNMVLDDIESGLYSVVECVQAKNCFVDYTRLNDLMQQQKRYGTEIEVLFVYSNVQKPRWAELTDKFLDVLLQGNYTVFSFRAKRYCASKIVRGPVCTPKRYNHTEPINILRIRNVKTH